MKNTKKTRWIRLALGVILLLFAGIIYSWSVIKAPFDEFWSKGQLGFCFTLTLCTFCIGGVISGFLGKYLSPRLRMTIAAVMVAGGFIIVSYIDGSSIVPLYLGYGVLSGLGIGIVYNVVIASTNAWFPDKKGLASGLMMMGFGLTTLVFGNLFTYMFDLDGFGWKKTYLLLGCFIGILLLIGGLFVAPPVLKKKKASSKAKAVTDTNDFTTPEMLKRPSFWKLFAFFVLFAAVGSTAIGAGKDYFLSLDASGNFAVTLVGIVSVCNAVGRLASGAIFDALGLRRTQFITSGVVIAASGVTLIGALTGSLPIGIIGLCLCGFSYGFSPTVSAAFAGAFYGTKNYALNFSVLNLVLIPASFMSTFAGKIYGSTGSYAISFAVLLGCSVVGLVINYFIKKA